MTRGLKDLSEEDIKLLKQSWLIIGQNIQKIGVDIFVMIFKQCPEAKYLFPFTYASNKDSGFIKFHSLRFMQAIKSVINFVENFNETSPLLTNLGHVHGRLKERVDFKPEYWTVFRECTLYHFRRAFENNTSCFRIRKLFGLSNSANVDRLITLWGMVLDYMISEMTASFQANVKARILNKNNWVQDDNVHIYASERRETIKMQRTQQ